MGDAILFLMAVEEAFDVEIPDSEAEQLQTIGQLDDWLSSRLRQRIAPLETAPCLSVYAFNRVRRALNASVKARPQTALEDLLPSPKLRHQRRAQWSQLSAQGLPIPPLEWTPRLKITLETLWFAAAAVSSLPALFIAFNWPLPQLWPFWWLPIAFGFSAYFVLLSTITKGVHHLLSPYKIHPPLPTIGELTQHLAHQNYWQLASARGSWSEAEAWRVLQKLVAREAATSPDEVQRDTQFRELLFWD